MTWDEQYWVAQAMVKKGGGFIKALGEALRLADAENAAKLKEAFPGIWRKFQGVGEEMRNEQRARERSRALAVTVSG